MTETQVLETIQIVTNRLKSRFTFKYYDEDDISQESFLICISALERYDGKRPLENFLYVNLRNRLKSFIRDNYKKIVGDTILENENFILDNEFERSSFIVNFEKRIDELLTPDLRNDYWRIKDGIKLPRPRRVRLENKIRELIKEGEIYNEWIRI